MYVSTYTYFSVCSTLGKWLVKIPNRWIFERARAFGKTFPIAPTGAVRRYFTVRFPEKFTDFKNVDISIPVNRSVKKGTPWQTFAPEVSLQRTDGQFNLMVGAIYYECTYAYICMNNTKPVRTIVDTTTRKIFHIPVH